MLKNAEGILHLGEVAVPAWTSFALIGVLERHKRTERDGSTVGNNRVGSSSKDGVSARSSLNR